MEELGTRCTTERVHVGNAPPKGARAALLPDRSGDLVALDGLPVSCPSARWRGPPPFWATVPGATPAAASRPRTSHPRDDSRRRCAHVEPCSGTSPAHARRGGVSLPALVGPCALRAPGQPRQLSWLRDGSRDQCVVELARPEASGQSTA